MMKRINIRLIVAGILLTIITIQAHADDGYDRLNSKAERFITFQEWNSAHAMYLLMADKRPDDANAYSRAIVTSGLLDDDNMQMELLERTQRRGIPLDSIFTETRRFALDIGKSQEYEHFLKLVKDRQPWMARHINMRLLEYYDFRNNAPDMVKTGNELLNATPDNIEYLNTVARGYMLMSDFENATATFKRILEIDNNNYDALIALGNYYAMVWHSAEGTRSQMSSTREEAVNYLQKAYNLRPTPFVAQQIKKLL